MKKVLAIACLLVILTMAVAAVASAQTQGNWRLYFKVADTNNMNYTQAQIGVYSSSKDGYGVDGTASDAYDVRVALTQSASIGVAGTFGDKAWGTDMKSNRLPSNDAYNAGQAGPMGSVFGDYPYESNRKFWDLRVAGLGTANTGLNTVLTIRFVSTAAGLPPAAGLLKGQNPGGQTGPLHYALRMVDNRGIEGAPANGTVWDISAVMPTTWSSVAFFSLTLPTFNLSVAKDEQALINEGYKLQFYQTPEPSSLLALGAGLMGLAGFASRKRRS